MFSTCLALAAKCSFELLSIGSQIGIAILCLRFFCLLRWTKPRNNGLTSETNRKQKENGETEQRSAKWSALSSGRGIQNAFVVIVSVLCLYSQIVRQKRKQLCNSQADHQGIYR